MRTSIVFEEVKYYISLGYHPEDIFILSPSIKSTNKESPIRILENMIKTETNINVYAASENEKIDGEIIKGKIVFATFHQTKGLERKVSIVFNFDESYFRFFKKDVSTLLCPNELYVAVTRSLERLTLVHNNKDDYLPFLQKNDLEKYCHIIGFKKDKRFCTLPRPTETNPTALLCHLPSNVLDECMEFLNIKQIRPPCRKIHISSKTKKISNNDTCESVSELSGVAIPTYYELQIKGVMNIYNTLIAIQFPTVYPSLKKNQIIRSKLRNICIDKLTPEELLFIVNCWDCAKSNLLFKMYQIKKYDWLPKNILIQCMDRLTSLNISTDSRFELQYDVPNIDAEPRHVEICGMRLTIRGYVDCLDQSNLYEFKCVSELNVEHHLQLAIYMYMDKYIRLQFEDKILHYKSAIEKLGNTSENFIYHDSIRSQIDELQTKLEKDEKEFSYKCDQMVYHLYNVLSDELINITCDMESLTKMMEILVTYKYFKSKRISDDVFLDDVIKIRNDIETIQKK